jgi:hypothetical protein
MTLVPVGDVVIRAVARVVLGVAAHLVELAGGAGSMAVVIGNHRGAMDKHLDSCIFMTTDLTLFWG